MNADRKKLLTLTSLALAWVGLALWQWSSMEEPIRVPLSNRSGPSAGEQSSRVSGGGLRVRLDLLPTSKTQRELAFATPKNIFFLPAQAGSERAGIESSSDSSEQEQAVATDLAQFRYLGYVRTGEESERKRDLAVLTKNDDLHLVRKGETVEKRVVVKTITQDSVTLQDRESSLEHTVTLSEEETAQP
jgi:hypothetical protein